MSAHGVGYGADGPSLGSRHLATQAHRIRPGANVGDGKGGFLLHRWRIWVCSHAADDGCERTSLGGRLAATRAIAE